MTWVVLSNGKVFDFTKNTMPNVTPDVIAHSLANQCRFAGHTPSFYSVAEHSWRVMRLVGDSDAYAALMHDAHKSVIQDIIRPLKTYDFKNFEAMVMGLFEDHFGYVIHQGVEAADSAILAAEFRHFFGRDLPDVELAKRGREALKSHGAMDNCMDPTIAKTVWLDAFGALCPPRFSSEGD